MVFGVSNIKCMIIKPEFQDGITVASCPLHICYSIHLSYAHVCYILTTKMGCIPPSNRNCSESMANESTDLFLISGVLNFNDKWGSSLMNQSTQAYDSRTQRRNEMLLSQWRRSVSPSLLVIWMRKQWACLHQTEIGGTAWLVIHGRTRLLTMVAFCHSVQVCRTSSNSGSVS
ncbi:hypothetical protein T4B_12508 [Trichinella pseudospiralis]|uniref:Uncharacterized protein n=1 Tax=Trichinella pseudospiralis TaxID=6337 RepID=A0A0V1JE78_TRIPS|nr:hypothetical protein T4B_12508 [Trichinella pseudospiralis]